MQRFLPSLCLLDLKAPEQHAIQPSAEAGTQHRNAWVQVANYATVVHAQASLVPRMSAADRLPVSCNGRSTDSDMSMAATRGG